MADLEQNLEELESVKQEFKNKILANDISTANVEFRNYPTLLNQMKKKLPTQKKRATPTKEGETITADSGYDLTEVEIDPIPSEYIIPNGTKSITSNGTHAVTEYASVDVSVSSEQPNLITKEITQNGTYNASDDNVDGYSSVTVNVASGGSGGGGNFFDRTFANNTPAQISQVSALISYNNMTSSQVAETYGWNIGDTISYQLTTGENVEMRIIGFNHDDRSDGGGKAGITLETVLANVFTGWNLGSSANNVGGFGASNMYNATILEYENKIPQDWRNIIKPVNKLFANGGGDAFSGVVSDSFNLFILSATECGQGMGQNASEEGSLYEYYQTNDRIKYVDSDADGIPDNTTEWWTRTCGSSNKTAIYINTTGFGRASSLYYGKYISPVFCV